MATCKDCFHYDLCKARGMKSVEILDCTYFKDKSKIKEFPCDAEEINDNEIKLEDLNSVLLNEYDVRIT